MPAGILERYQVTQNQGLEKKVVQGESPSGKHAQQMAKGSGNRDESEKRPQSPPQDGQKGRSMGQGGGGMPPPPYDGSGVGGGSDWSGDDEDEPTDEETPSYHSSMEPSWTPRMTGAGGGDGGLPDDPYQGQRGMGPW